MSLHDLPPAQQTTGRLSFGERAFSWSLRHLPVKHGKHRLLDRLYPEPRHQVHRTVTVPFAESHIDMAIGDLVGWHFAMLRGFDPEVTEVLTAAASRESAEVFWDIGANKGACSYAIAAALPTARIVAIEPQDSLAPRLQANLRRVAPGRFELVHAGISTAPGILELTIPDGNDGAGTLHPAELGVRGRTINVPMQTASAIVLDSEFGPPTLVKIDVEGHEAQVFASLEPFLDPSVCRAVVFENHASKAQDFQEIAAIANSHGYRIFGIEKTLFRTCMQATDIPLSRATDYAMISNDLAQSSLPLRRLVSGGR